MSGRKEAFRSLKSREAGVWIGTFTILFVAAVLFLDVVGAPTLVVFVAGIAWGEFADRTIGPFTDRYLDRREAEDDRRTTS
jgi:hypothetical protein